MNELSQQFQQILQALQKLEQTMTIRLQWSVVEAQPSAESGHIMVDKYDEAIVEMLGILEGARAAAAEGQQAAQTGDRSLARQALIHCQSQCTSLVRTFYQGPLSTEWMQALTNLAHERRGPWPAWVDGVLDALQECPAVLYAIEDALLGAWKQLTANLDHPAYAQAINHGPSIYLYGEEVDKKNRT